MIKRTYFYSAIIENKKISTHVDGTVSVKSFFSNPRLAWVTARNYISNRIDGCDEGDIHIKSFTRI